MVKKVIFFYLVLFAAMVTSCNSESEIISSEMAVENDGIEMVRISDDGSSFEAIDPDAVSLRSGTLDDNITLKFKDEEALKKALANAKSTGGKFKKFKSLTDIYEEAMEWGGQKCEPNCRVLLYFHEN